MTILKLICIAIVYILTLLICGIIVYACDWVKRHQGDEGDTK